MTILDLVTKFEAYLLTERRVSENTFVAYKRDLKQFVDFLEKEQLHDMTMVGLEEVRRFVRSLHDAGLSARSIARKIAALKGLYRYLEQSANIPNHASELTMPKLPRRLPGFLSETEMGRLFESAAQDVSPIGKRNMVMLYMLYVTGMRVSELVHLKAEDLQEHGLSIRVEGKGGKQRLIPLPELMRSLLLTYLNHDRAILIKQHGHTPYLFPVLYGGVLRALSRQAFWFIIKRFWKKAGIERPVSPHTLRHSFATHLLKKGANIRALQLLLGHEHLATVQMYTHVDTEYLRAIYDKKHPRS